MQRVFSQNRSGISLKDSLDPLHVRGSFLVMLDANAVVAYLLVVASDIRRCVVVAQRSSGTPGLVAVREACSLGAAEHSVGCQGELAEVEDAGEFVLRETRRYSGHQHHSRCCWQVLGH